MTIHLIPVAAPANHRGRRAALAHAAPPRAQRPFAVLELALALATLLLGTTTAYAQPASRNDVLRLRDVLTAVDSSAFDGRARHAEARIADANVTASRAAFLPALRLEAGTARTTDPIGVFGARLRRRIVTAADFDPARLNRPDALDITSSAIVLEQPVFAASAWMGRRAAQFAALASHAASDRADEQARLAAAEHYADAILASASLAALDAAVEAGTEHVRQATLLETNGIVTHSDVLLAQVRLGDIVSRRAVARGQTTLARLALAVMMGAPGDTARPLAATLPETPTLLAAGEAAASEMVVSASIRSGGGSAAFAADTRRGDVRAAELAVQAARADARRAAARWLPTIGATLRSDWATAGQPFGGTPFWTAGVMVSLPVFSGGATLADQQRTTAAVHAAESRAEGAAAMAALDVTQTHIDRAVATDRLRLAEEGHTQAREALRLVRRRYEGGLAAISELLDADAASTTARLSTELARHDLLVALIAERVALGLDLTPLLALDP